MSWLCCHSRASLTLFCSSKASDLNSRSCSSFSRRKPITSQLKIQLCFYPQCHFHLAPYVFMSLQIFPLLFLLISWAFYFSFSIWYCLFWVSPSVLRSFSSIMLGLQEVATFDFSSFFWLVPFHEGSKMISKNSCR